ncbi:hypothetical protein ACH42_10500 [Endozoicomonas sp. (ex Bugula neritina AB1)]|nr:hypothetical protein ACH42_10500 [Endozoicomonas sp. (ex Bugula neritina AB1)]
MPVNPTGILNQLFDRCSVRTQLMLIFGILMISLTLSMCFVVRSEIDAASAHQADSIGQLVSEQTSSAATDMLVTGDRLSLNVLLNQLVQNPYVTEASIFSIDNRRISRATSQNSDNTPANKVYSAPIHYQDVIAGYVRITLNENLLTKKPQDALTIITAIGFLLLLIGLLLINFYSSNIARQLKLLERQLISILPDSSTLSSVNEVARISTLVESQLTEKRSEIKEDEPEPLTETAAILAIRTKNLGRLKQLLAPKDLQEILRTFSSVIERSVSFYEGELTYTPEGNVFIRFSSRDNPEFSLDALSCGLMIEDLVNFAGENSIANIHIGIGLSFSDDISEFPEEKHPALSDSAASQSLHLAAVSEPDGLHMFKANLSWLPTDLPDLKVSELDPDMIKIDGLTGEQASILKNQITEMLADF